MLKNKFLLPLVALFAILVSCSSDDNNSESVAPSIVFLNLNGQGSNLNATIGKSINIVGEFEDNKELSTLDISAFNAQGDMAFSQIFDLTGSRAQFTGTLLVPNTLEAGNYQIIATLKDASGNRTTLDYTLTLVTDKPNITILGFNNPATDTIFMDVNATYILRGLISDDEDLSLVNIRLNTTASGAGLTEIYDEEFTFSGANDLSWDYNGGLFIQIPWNALREHYKLTISAFDQNNTGHTVEAKVYIRP